MKSRIFVAVAATVLATFTLAAVRPIEAAAANRSHTVVIEQMKFAPAEIRIHSGDRIVFQNNDVVPHTATARDSGVFDSGPIKPGEAWTLHVAGGEQTIDYACQYHPMMNGRIIVAMR